MANDEAGQNNSIPNLAGSLIQECDYCKEAGIDIPHPEGIKTCSKCGHRYCVQHSSKLDPQFCQKEQTEIEVKESIFERVQEDYDEVTDTLNRTTQKCKQITFDGANWIWYSKAVQSQTDDQLKASIEYHRAIVYTIENELTTRRVKKLQAASKAPAGFTTRTTIEKKTTKTTKPKQPLGLADIQEMAKKMGVPFSQLQALLGGK